MATTTHTHVINSAQGEVLAEYTCKKVPPALKWWLDEYTKEMDVEVDEKVITKAPARAAAAITIEPLMDGIMWGQKAPWWANLKFPHPTKEGARCYCLTGCVATAIAQVLYYWAKKGKRRGCLATKAYTTQKYKYSVAAMPSVPIFDWASMTGTKPTTTAGKKAVAMLSEYCGKAAQADYGYSSTSAPMKNVAPVLKNYFGMGDARRVENVSNATLKAEIIAELRKESPVIMCGQSEGSGCHCFICDGYRSSDDMFHFLWGWEGDGDGWFKLTALSPNSKDFSTKKNAIVGLSPHLLGDVNGDGRINMSDVTKIISVANSGEYDRAADLNSDGKVDIEDVNKEVDVILGKEKL